MQIIDLTAYLPQQSAPVRKRRSAAALVAVVESIVTVAIGLCFFVGVVIAISIL